MAAIANIRGQLLTKINQEPNKNKIQIQNSYQTPPRNLPWEVREILGYNQIRQPLHFRFRTSQSWYLTINNTSNNSFSFSKYLITLNWTSKSFSGLKRDFRWGSLTTLKLLLPQSNPQCNGCSQWWCNKLIDVHVSNRFYSESNGSINRQLTDCMIHPEHCVTCFGLKGRREKGKQRIRPLCSCLQRAHGTNEETRYTHRTWKQAQKHEQQTSY